MTEKYNILDRLNVLTRSKQSKTKYYCPVCNGDDLDISKNGAYRCFSGDCAPKDIRNAIDKLEGKSEWQPEKFVKPIRSKSQTDYYYPERATSHQGDRIDDRLVKVTRIDDGNGGKKFYQSYWNGGKWANGNPDNIKKLIPIYRYAEIRQAIKWRELIFVVEGEAIEIGRAHV